MNDVLLLAMQIHVHIQTFLNIPFLLLFIFVFSVLTTSQANEAMSTSMALELSLTLSLTASFSSIINKSCNSTNKYNDTARRLLLLRFHTWGTTVFIQSCMQGYVYHYLYYMIRAE